MAAGAQAYDEVSTPQYEMGCQFINELKISLGAKVLDMGCGTGNLTKYITDIVGPDGEVAGVDPDASRIKIAEEKYRGVRNLHFRVGDSVTGFPHDSEPYYDAHISTFAFHWVPNEEKNIYIQKAYECLKPGGKLGIYCLEESVDVKNLHLNRVSPLTLDGYHKIFEDLGLFNNVVITRKFIPIRFASFEIFKRWFKATSHQEFEEIDPAFAKKVVTRKDDGTIFWNLPRISIRATKSYL